MQVFVLAYLLTPHVLSLMSIECSDLGLEDLLLGDFLWWKFSPPSCPCSTVPISLCPGNTELPKLYQWSGPLSLARGAWATGQACEQETTESAVQPLSLLLAQLPQAGCLHWQVLAPPKGPSLSLQNSGHWPSLQLPEGCYTPHPILTFVIVPLITKSSSSYPRWESHPFPASSAHPTCHCISFFFIITFSLVFLPPGLLSLGVCVSSG